MYGEDPSNIYLKRYKLWMALCVEIRQYGPKYHLLLQKAELEYAMARSIDEYRQCLDTCYDVEIANVRNNHEVYYIEAMCHYQIANLLMAEDESRLSNQRVLIESCLADSFSNIKKALAIKSDDVDVIELLEKCIEKETELQFYNQPGTVV